MDFVISEDQQAIIDLSGRILSEGLPPERIKQIEAADRWFAEDVWRALADADLIGLSLPEADGGGGYGFFELALLLEQVGRHVAPLPVLSTLVMGALAVVEFGDDGQRAGILPKVISGDLHMTAALTEPGHALPPATPRTTARRDGDRWLLSGTKHLVPGGHVAELLIVAAATGDGGITGDGGTTAFLVRADAPGVTAEHNTSINGEPLTTFTFEDAEVSVDDVLGDVGGGTAVVRSITDRAVAATCALQAGVCEAATRITGIYTSERRQFGSPIATFQAVAHRVADAYIDTEAVRLTARQAAWRLSEGLDATDALAIAKYWAATGAHRVVHAAQHVHGGIGVDTDYPVHRTYRWAKHLEHSFGSGSAHLRSLGASIAAT